MKNLKNVFFRWSEATRLCRFVKDDSLWAMLAAMATHAKQLETAEVAYAAINEADKVIPIEIECIWIHFTYFTLYFDAFGCLSDF